MDQLPLKEVHMFIFKQTATQTVELKEDDFQQEAYMEGFLIENTGLLARGESGDAELLARQVFLGKKDRVDLVVLTIDDDILKLMIVEIKKGAAGTKALQQLQRYVELWHKNGHEILQQDDEALKTARNCLTQWGKHGKLDFEKLSREVGGILVAPRIEDEVAEQLSGANNVYGVQLARYRGSEVPEAFVFVKYFPEAKRAALSAGQFWKSRQAAKRKKVESILASILKEDPDIAYKYWKTILSVYPNSEEAEKFRPYRLGRIVRGDRKFTCFHSMRGVGIDLSTPEEIVKQILKEKRVFLER